MVILACALPHTYVALWAGCLVTGVGIGSLMPTALGFGKNKTHHTGILSSSVLTSSYIGRILAPPIIGYLLDNKDPMWFTYINVAYTSAVVLFFGILVLLRLVTKVCATQNQPEVKRDDTESVSLDQLRT